MKFKQKNLKPTLITRAKNIIKSKRFKKALNLTFLVVITLFLYIYIKKLDLSALKNLKINPYLFGVAMILSLAVRFYNSAIWMNILNGFGNKKINKYIELTYAYAKSALGRYIPGKVAWIAGRVAFAQKHGFSTEKLAISSVFEAGILVFTGFAEGIILLLITDSFQMINRNTKIFILSLTFLSFLTLFPPIFNKFLKFAVKIFKNRSLKPDEEIKFNQLFSTSILFAIMFFFNATVMILVIKSLYANISYEMIFKVAGTMALASSVGITAIIAPSGIGVKEGIQILILNSFLPKEIVFVAVIMYRILMVVNDLIFFGVSSVLKSFNSV